jgi:diguanylate cyclase (GGDEF)-like protein
MTSTNSSHADIGSSGKNKAVKPLAKALGQSEEVSRHECDEFLYLLTEVESHQELTLVAEKLATSIKLPMGVAVDGKHIEISLAASIGIAIYPDDCNTAQDLVKSADKAMYRAKKGRLRHAFVQ